MADDAIVLRFESEGADDVAGDAGNLATILDHVDQTLKQVNATLKAGGNASKQAAAGASAHAKSAQSAVGPMQNLAKAQQRYNDAVKSGNQAQIFDAGANLLQKHKALARSQKQMTPPSPADSMHDLINSSRVAYGPNGQLQMMPLVNKLAKVAGKVDLAGILNMAGNGGSALRMAGTAGMDTVGMLAGESAAAGPIGIAVAAFVAAIGAMVAALKMATERVNSSANLQLAGGGSAKETALAMNIGGSLGIDPTKFIEGIAGAMNTGRPGAAYYAQKVRVSPYGNAFAGDQDFTNKAEKILNEFLHANQKEAFQMAQIFPELKEVGQYRYLTEGSKQKLLSDTSGSYSSQQMQDAAEAQLAYNNVMKDFNKEMAEFGTKYLPVATMWLKGLDVALGMIGDTINALNPVGNIQKWVENQFGGGGVQDAAKEHANALKDHTKALNQNTMAINGMYGSSQTGRRVIPTGWGPDQFSGMGGNHAARALGDGAFVL